MSEEEKKRERAIQALQRYRARWDEVPKKELELFGQVYSPDSLDQLMLLFGQFSMLDIGGWRGQADANWRLDPSLVRRWREHRTWMGPSYPLDEPRLRRHERDVIEQTREAGFLEPTAEVELLARLQHHGGATRLLDCTRNAFVALWFACQGAMDRDGVLVGFRLGPNQTLKLDTEHLDRDMDELLQEAEGRLLWWQPRQQNPRIAAQQALFVFSEYVDREWGSVNLSGEPEMSGIGDVPGLACISISKEMKQQMEAVWEPLFGFSEASLFPDFDGFAASQGVDKPFRHGAPI